MINIYPTRNILLEKSHSLILRMSVQNYHNQSVNSFIFKNKIFGHLKL